MPLQEEFYFITMSEHLLGLLLEFSYLKSKDMHHLNILKKIFETIVVLFMIVNSVFKGY